MPPSPVIEVDALEKSYRNGMFGKPVEALRGVSFQVGRGEIFGLLGPNGAGKTTFVKVLLGIVRKTGGTATLMGRTAGDRRGRRRVGYLPENLRVPRHHTGATALAYYGSLSGMSRAEIRAKRDGLLEAVGLADWGRVKIKKYSKGMLQRLGLAQSLLHDPDLLILDEPTDGLDPLGRAQVRVILSKLRDDGKTVFVNSHLLQEVELMCDRVAILDKGKLRRIGPVHEITSRAGRQEQAGKQKRHKSEGLELTLELAAPKDIVTTALAKRPVKNWQVVGPDRFRLVTHLADQGAVNCCIDELRKHGVSIISLSPRRITLEDVFLEIVEGPPKKS